MYDSKPPDVTDLEAAILRYIALGYQSKEIADKLQRSTPTVEGHVRILYARFGARSRAHLVVLALQHGIIDLDYDDNGLCGGDSSSHMRNR